MQSVGAPSVVLHTQHVQGSHTGESIPDGRRGIFLHYHTIRVVVGRCILFNFAKMYFIV